MAENINKYATSFTTPIIANNSVYILNSIPNCGFIILQVKDTSNNALLGTSMFCAYSLAPTLGAAAKRKRYFSGSLLRIAPPGTILLGTTGGLNRVRISPRNNGTNNVLDVQNRTGGNVIVTISFVINSH